MKRSPIKRKHRKPKPGDNPAFLAFVRTLPCFVCYREVYEFFGSEPWALIELLESEATFPVQRTRTEAAHLGRSTSRRGLKQKYPDNESGPLCSDHHTRFKTSHHANARSFWDIHGIERDELIDQIQALYAQSKAYR